MMIFLNITMLAIIAFGTWWLTGIDKTVSGEGKRDRHFPRLLRCGAILFLAAVFLWFIEQRDSGYGGVGLLIIIPISVALLLRGSLAEFFTHGVLRMVDPALYDDRELDLKKQQLHLDNIARLIHSGQREKAIQLCEELKQSGEVDATTLATTLEYLGVPQTGTKIIKPLAKVDELQSQGKFAEAELMLNSLLTDNPRDLEAAMKLMRLYAQDLRRPDQATAVLRKLEKQPYIAASLIDFARRSINEWSQTSRETAQTVPSIEPMKVESVETLLAQKFFGSAVELLENQIKAQPQDFDLRLKLAEVQATYCHNFSRAEKIVRQMETDVSLSAVQIASAKAKLTAWREDYLDRK